MGLTPKCAVGPGTASGQQAESVQPDPEIVNQLVGMGFSENGSKRAAVATQVSQGKSNKKPIRMTSGRVHDLHPVPQNEAHVVVQHALPAYGGTACLLPVRV